MLVHADDSGVNLSGAIVGADTTPGFNDDFWDVGQGSVQFQQCLLALGSKQEMFRLPAICQVFINDFNNWPGRFVGLYLYIERYSMADTIKYLFESRQVIFVAFQLFVRMISNNSLVTVWIC